MGTTGQHNGQHETITTKQPETDLGIGKEGQCPPKCPDCPTKHDGMQNSHIGVFYVFSFSEFNLLEFY